MWCWSMLRLTAISSNCFYPHELYNVFLLLGDLLSRSIFLPFLFMLNCSQWLGVSSHSSGSFSNMIFIWFLTWKYSVDYFFFLRYFLSMTLSVYFFYQDYLVGHHDIFEICYHIFHPVLLGHPNLPELSTQIHCVLLIGSSYWYFLASLISTWLSN